MEVPELFCTLNKGIARVMLPTVSVHGTLLPVVLEVDGMCCAGKVIDGGIGLLLRCGCRLQAIKKLSLAKLNTLLVLETTWIWMALALVY